VDPLADKYPSMSPYMYTAGNPVMLVDPDGRWVKGAGLFDNIFKSDNRIYAERTAREHPGAIVARINDNERKGWGVYWMEDDAFIIKDKEHTIRLSTFVFVEFTSPKKTKSKKKGWLFFGSGQDESNSTAEKGEHTNTPFELIDPFGVDPIFELSWNRTQPINQEENNEIINENNLPLSYKEEMYPNKNKGEMVHISQNGFKCSTRYYTSSEDSLKMAEYLMSFLGEGKIISKDY
jgi:hypothetical protein